MEAFSCLVTVDPTPLSEWRYLFGTAALQKNWRMLELEDRADQHRNGPGPSTEQVAWNLLIQSHCKNNAVLNFPMRQFERKRFIQVFYTEAAFHLNSLHSCSRGGNCSGRFSWTSLYSALWSTLCETGRALPILQAKWIDFFSPLFYEVVVFCLLFPPTAMVYIVIFYSVLSA